MTDQKVAIVTGAGSGIGRATSIDLASRGFHVVLVGRTESKLNETASLANGGTIEVVDICQSDQCHDLIKRTSRIDAIANVAGAAPMLPIEKVNDATWRTVIDTNLSAVVNLTAAAWPKLNSGTVVNVSSMASIDPFPGLAIYAAAKAGLNMFTRCTAQEGQAIGLKAVGVAPGAVETPMLRSLFDEQTIPRDKTLDPADVARVICDCITGDREFESGETIVVPSPA